MITWDFWTKYTFLAKPSSCNINSTVVFVSDLCHGMLPTLKYYSSSGKSTSVPLQVQSPCYLLIEELIKGKIEVNISERYAYQLL